MSSALQLKEEGNRHFRTGDYSGAESFYSKASVSPLFSPLSSSPSIS